MMRCVLASCAHNTVRSFPSPRPRNMKSILSLGVVVPLLLFVGWPIARPRPRTQVTHQLLCG
eukprot:5558030-Amphidinium_carterae.1